MRIFLCTFVKYCFVLFGHLCIMYYEVHYLFAQVDTFGERQMREYYRYFFFVSNYLESPDRFTFKQYVFMFDVYKFRESTAGIQTICVQHLQALLGYTYTFHGCNWNPGMGKQYLKDLHIFVWIQSMNGYEQF